MEDLGQNPRQHRIERAEQIKLDNFDNIFISGDFQGFMDRPVQIH